MSTYTIVGANLHEVAKSLLYDYFKAFGALSDHIVRLKSVCPPADAVEGAAEFASFTIHYRALEVDESLLLGQTHVIAGIEVRCLKQGNEGAVAERKVFIKYLDKKADADDIKQCMAKYGEVEAVHISMKKDKSMNLGLGNVLFKHKDSVLKVLNDPSVIIRNKKVKVEQFKCGSVGSKTPSLYLPNSLKMTSPYAHKTWTEPVLNRLSKPSSSASPYGIQSIKSKTVISVQEMQSLHNSDQEMDRPLLRVALVPSLTSPLMPGTSRDAKDSAILDVSTKNGDPVFTNGDQMKSLDFSLIEEECEESPRLRRGSENFHLSPRAHYDEGKERLNRCPIICVHGGIQELNSAIDSQKGSFHSVKPTCKTYYKNPRHHLVPMAKNHKETNLRLNRRSRNIVRAPLSGAVQSNTTELPRFRLF